MAELLKSKKVLMVLGTIIGNVIVMVLYQMFPDTPPEVVQYLVAGLNAVGLGGAFGQGLADGMSRGVTSSRGRDLVELDKLREANRSAELQALKSPLPSGPAQETGQPPSPGRETGPVESSEQIE